MPDKHFTPTELSNYFECEHRSVLDRVARARKIERPGQTEIERELLALRGYGHEEAVLAHYRSLGLAARAVAAPSASATDLSKPKASPRPDRA
jgi:hypothetical protein